MEVAHTTDHVTHAVIGGLGNISFGISDDPAFFQILSASLYKDPTLAMVRETICNGWDAHIDSGLTDKPLSITLDDDNLVIQDFGRGIPHELIGPIYGVYGASTKKNDGRQTGGFGLGCKSPFAYTDHFEVISCHEGKKTLYRMSKSSAEKMGKPSIVPIATFPTEESGITVTIPLKNDSQDYRLDSLVRQVVFNGDIKAMFNEVELPVLGLNEAQSEFILINDAVHMTAPLSTFEGHRIFVRYGNVIYPVEATEEIRSLWGKVQNMLARLYKCRLVLMAPPNSISVTPSRESLTASEVTVKTLTELLTGFLAKLTHNRDVAVRYENMVDEYIDNAAKDTVYSTHYKLSRQNWRMPGIPDNHHSKFLSSTDDFALLEVLLKYGQQSNELNTAKWIKTMGRYLYKMVEQGLLERGLVQSWLHDATRGKKVLRSPARSHYEFDYGGPRSAAVSEQRIATAWWQRRVALPLVQKLKAATEHVTNDNVYYMSSNLLGKQYYKHRLLPKKLAAAQIRNHTLNLSNLVKPSVVLCHNASVIVDRVKQVNKTNLDGSIYQGSYFIIEVPRTKGIAEAVAESLKDLKDVEIINLMGRLPVEEVAYQERLASSNALKARRAKLVKEGKPVINKKNRPGLIRMDALLFPDSDLINTMVLVTEEDPVRLTTPTFIAKVSTADGAKHVTNSFDTRMSYAIAKLWGDQGVVTNNQGVYERQTEKGIMELTAFVVDKVKTELSVSPTIKTYMGFSPKNAESYLTAKTGGYSKRNELLKLYTLMLELPPLQALIPGFTPLSETDELRLVVWEGIANTYPWSHDKTLKEATQDILNVGLEPQVATFLQSLIDNPFLGFIDVGSLGTTIVGIRQDPVALAKLTTIIQTILN